MQPIPFGCCQPHLSICRFSLNGLEIIGILAASWMPSRNISTVLPAVACLELLRNRVSGVGRCAAGLRRKSAFGGEVPLDVIELSHHFCPLTFVWVCLYGQAEKSVLWGSYLRQTLNKHS